jgi:type II restriction enzyme
MATRFQDLGAFGEKCIVKNCFCPRCKRARTLVRLPSNFKCADVICDFCGYLAQVKTATATDPLKIPDKIRTASWRVQKDRMDAGIFFPIFLVLVANSGKYAIHYLSADLQPREIFMPRQPLPKTARRAGWQGCLYDFRAVRKSFVQLKPPPNV